MSPAVCVCDLGFPSGASGKEPACQCRRRETRFDPWIGKIPWRRCMATYSSILAWRILSTEEAWRTAVHGVAKSQI